jgi:Bacterial Ig-like domain
LLVESFLPAANDQKVPRGAMIEVVFNQPVSNDQKWDELLRVQDAPQSFLTGEIEFEDSKLRFRPSTPMGAGKTYTATIKAGVKSSRGTELAAAKSWSFKTQLSDDSAAPTFVSSFPASGSDWGLGRPIVLFFNEPVTLDATNGALLYNQSGQAVTATAAAYGNAIQITPSASQAAGVSTWRVVVNVADLAGNKTSKDLSLSLDSKTLSASNFNFISSTPADGNQSLNISEGVLLTFSSPILPSSTAATALEIVDTDSNPVAAVESHKIFEGNTVLVKSVEPLKHSRNYRIRTNGELKSLPLNGSFSSGSMVLANVKTRDPLAVSSSLPQNNSADNPLSSSFSVTFSKSINPGSVSENSIYVRDEVKNRIVGTWSVNGATLTFVPKKAYTLSKKYTFKFITDLSSTDGTTFDAEKSVTFSTITDAVWEASAKLAFTNHCTRCHSPYADRDSAVLYKDAIQRRVSSGSMPPGGGIGADRNKILDWIQEAN